MMEATALPSFIHGLVEPPRNHLQEALFRHITIIMLSKVYLTTQTKWISDTYTAIFTGPAVLPPLGVLFLHRL